MSRLEKFFAFLILGHEQTKLQIVCALLILALLSNCGITPYYTVAPIDAQVVDFDTKLPIDGALVVANWQLIIHDLHGEQRRGQLEVKETITDESGRFHFNGFTKLNSMVYGLGAQDPKIIIFKAGYAYSRIANNHTNTGAYRKAGVNGTVIKLKKLTPVVVAKNRTYYSGLSFEMRPLVEDCEWRKISRMILAMEFERLRITAIEPEATVDVFPIEEFERSKSECRWGL